MDDLDDELRRLFSDDRLDVHSEPVAVEAVVSGARRRRRRRQAVTGAFVVVALVGAGVGLVTLDPSRPEETTSALLTTGVPTSTTPPPSPSTSTVVSTVTRTVDAPPPTGSGNTGTPGTGNTGKPSSSTSFPPLKPPGQLGRYGSLVLGMTEADALATGSLVEPGTAADPEQRCKAYATTSVPDPRAVVVSPVRGIVRITMPSHARTQENVGSGSTVTEVKAAYADAVQSGSTITVQMPSIRPWSYVFESDGTTVTTVFLRSAANDCSSV